MRQERNYCNPDYIYLIMCCHFINCHPKVWRWRVRSRRARRCRWASCVSGALSRSNWTRRSTCWTGSPSRSSSVGMNSAVFFYCCGFFFISCSCCRCSDCVTSLLLSPAGHRDPQQTGWQQPGGDTTRGGFCGSAARRSVCSKLVKLERL